MLVALGSDPGFQPYSCFCKLTLIFIQPVTACEDLSFRGKTVVSLQPGEHLYFLSCLVSGLALTSVVNT